jgi:LmbE family N-acetylglucosaminyl deacetylase
MVFAPHPDDEVLGCGGTILHMRRLGAEVDVVFLTDGGQSHYRLPDARELIRRRQAEALAAAAVLRVAAERLTFLAFADTRLSAHAESARQRIAARLAERCPSQVFVPYAHDPHPDHRATNAIVRAALRDVGQHPTVFEYPVHQWTRWPWCHRSSHGTVYAGVRPRGRGLLASLRFLLHCRRVVRIDAVVDVKQRALAAHASQVSAVLPGGPNLHQWSDGEFLAWACGPYEFFRQASRD